MDMLIAPERLELAEAVRDYLAGTHGAEVLRRLDVGPNRDPAIWQGLVEMGLTGLLVPEAHGGLDFGWQGLGLVFEAMGRHLVCAPLLAQRWEEGWDRPLAQWREQLPSRGLADAEP